MSDPAAPKPPSAWWSLAVTTAIQAMVSMALLTLPAMAPVAAQGWACRPRWWVPTWRCAIWRPCCPA
ncbi:hypothetical protein [Ottowia beijingensis]|uniref:hypothetical protein n=1 Tax=Ottowia beijingensis TaxID=1207057 RepID=UPI00214D27BC|nr:hypothetical protein [Ottowia beijingensis]